jgi:nitrogen fixation protein NifB
MKVAITTTNGKSIDMHFGKAKHFYIYELVNGGLKFMEKRESITFAPENEKHPFNEDRFNQVYQTIKDCRFLYTAKIGDTPAHMLRRNGVIAETMECEIDSLM